MARNLAAEWGNDPDHLPIRVNTISPGYIQTPMTLPTYLGATGIPGMKELWDGGNVSKPAVQIASRQKVMLIVPPPLDVGKTLNGGRTPVFSGFPSRRLEFVCHCC